MFRAVLSRLWKDRRSAPAIVKPETVIGWHRRGFRLFWAWKVRHEEPGRPAVSRGVRDLIRRMSHENPLWVAPNSRRVVEVAYRGRRNGFRCSRAHDISMEVLRLKSGRRERRFGSFDITKPMLRANVNAGLLLLRAETSIQQNLLSGRVRRCRQFCCGSMLNSRRHPGRWSLAL